MKKILSVILALAMVACLFAGCSTEAEKEPSGTPPTNGSASNDATGGNEPSDGISTTFSTNEVIELDFWHCISNATHLEILNKLVDDFNATVGAEKGIHVTAYAQGSQADLDATVMGAIKAGTVPNVTLSVPSYTAAYLPADCVVDLTPYVYNEEVGIEDIDDFYESFFRQGSEYPQEGLYSLPIHMKAEVLYYNVNFFEEHNLEVPSTWEELIETCRKIKEITGKPAFGWDSLASAFVTLSLEKGGEFADKEGNLNFLKHDDISKEVIKLWQDCIAEGIWRTAGEDNFFSGPFANEIVQMYVGVSTESSWINQKAVEGLKWAAAPIPSFEGSDVKATFQEGHVIEILSQDKNPDEILASWYFLKYMTSYEANLATACGSGYMPIRKSVAESEEYQNWCKENNNYASYVATQSSDFYYILPAFVTDTYTASGVWSEIKVMMGSILDNGVDVDTALNNLKAQFQ